VRSLCARSEYIGWIPVWNLKRSSLSAEEVNVAGNYYSVSVKNGAPSKLRGQFSAVAMKTFERVARHITVS
jgi:hypothetical protein